MHAEPGERPVDADQGAAGTVADQHVAVSRRVVDHQARASDDVDVASDVQHVAWGYVVDADLDRGVNRDGGVCANGGACTKVEKGVGGVDAMIVLYSDVSAAIDDAHISDGISRGDMKKRLVKAMMEVQIGE